MKLWNIVFYDLKKYFKDKGFVFISFLVPIILIIIVVSAFGGDNGYKPLKIPLINLDNSEFSQEIINSLKSMEGIEIEHTYFQNDTEKTMTEEYAINLIKNNNRSTAVLIPENFDKDIKSNIQTKFIILHNPTNMIIPNIVKGIIDAVSVRLSANLISVQVSVNEVMRITEGQADREKIAQNSLSNSMKLWENPPVVIETKRVVGAKDKKYDVVTQTIPGYALMFLLLTISSVATSLLTERQKGTFTRLIGSPINKPILLAGKLIPIAILNLIQLSVFFAFGNLVYGMDIGSSILGLIILSISAILAITGLGIFMAVLFKTAGQVRGFSLLIMMSMSALGGSFWPLDMVPDYMNTLAHALTINAWAMDGFKDLLLYGRGIVDILPEVGVLLGLALVFFTFGSLKFKFSIE